MPERALAGKWAPTDVWWELVDGCLGHLGGLLPQAQRGQHHSKHPRLAVARRPVKSGLVLSEQGEGLLDCGRLLPETGKQPSPGSSNRVFEGLVGRCLE